MKDFIFNVEKFEIQDWLDERFLMLKMFVAHVGLNRNMSNISKEAFIDAEKTFINIPILANLNSDKTDATSHDMDYIGEDENGEEVFEFFEIPVGLVPETNKLHYDEIDGREYVVVEGLIWADYNYDLKKIIKRDLVKSISFEIKILDAEWTKEKILDIKKFKVKGITILGNNVQSGMINSVAKLQSYELNNHTNFITKMNYALQQNNNEPNTANYNVAKIDVELNKNFTEMEDVIMEDTLKTDVPKELENMAEKEIEKEIEPKEEEKFEAPVEEVKENETIDYKLQFEEISTKYAEVSAKYEEICGKMSAMETEFTALKTFKSDIEAQEKQSKIEYAIQVVSEDLTADQKEEWKAKASSFEKVEEFTNAIKAFAYEMATSKKRPEKVEEFSRIHIPQETKVTKGLWD